jgi:TFIIF-interacting CTD phosphatase-like protein
MYTTKNGQSNEITIQSKERERSNKLCISVNPECPTRGVSLDNNKLTPKGITQLAFSKLVTQTSRDTTNINNTNLITQRVIEKEKIHSMSPPKKTLENNFLLPPQKINKKTLVLDLDETLIHSGFHSFECGNDIILKVSLII